jgi:ligand-binding sensor domain-containing protein
MCTAKYLCIAQQQLKDFDSKYRVIHWGIDQGLQIGRTTSFVKNVEGFLWIGTYAGLIRFDGKNSNTTSMIK